MLYIFWVCTNIELHTPIIVVSQSISTAQKILYVLPIHPPTLTPGNYWSFYCLYSFAFSQLFF